MIKKLLLITIEDRSNMGNRLQHYALQRSIEKLGYEVDSLMVKSAPALKAIIRAKNAVKYFLVSVGMKRFIQSLSVNERAVKMLSFNDHYLHSIVCMPVNKVFQADWADYAYVVTGSDQVWHNWHNKTIPNELSFYYLEFIEEARRFSYAPSFGFTEFPEEDIEAHRRGLTEMRALSCREQEGCELIRELTGREAQKVLDPTLLLTDKEWAEIENKPHFEIPERFLLCSFLGEVMPEYRAEITRIANKRGLQILNINDKNDLKHYAIGPDEFVWLVHHADTVCTDSFHASVFSIIFERNLRVFRREQKGFKDMFGRLHDLLEPLGLMDVVYGEGEELSTKLSEDAKAYLARERDVSLSYLKKSLSVE